MVEDSLRQEVIELLDFLEGPGGVDIPEGQELHIDQEKLEELESRIHRIRKLLEEELLIEAKWRTMS